MTHICSPNFIAIRSAFSNFLTFGMKMPNYAPPFGVLKAFDSRIGTSISVIFNDTQIDRQTALFNAPHYELGIISHVERLLTLHSLQYSAFLSSCFLVAVRCSKCRPIACKIRRK